MKKTLNTFLIILCTSFYAYADEYFLEDHKTEHEHILTPQQEEDMNKNFSLLNFRFPQRKWKECREQITGNYTEFKCTNKRNISLILKTFLFEHFEDCAEEALRKIGTNARIKDTHIVHAGIQGDRRHSPRSLHAENRAIDIKSVEFLLSNNRRKKFTFRHKSSNTFFNKVRSCWGKKIQRHNSCPLFRSNPTLTGSIGKEDSDHQRHMHLSVPHCIRGSYGSNYFRR